MKALSVPEKHQRKIALNTLKMNPAMIAVMGGMSLEEAIDFLRGTGDLQECGSCGGLHLRTFHGDCRDDANRF